MTKAEKRSVHTDALQTLGTIISANEKRDAIHIAVEPAQAGHGLKPGDHVGRLKNGCYGHCADTVGIVDPFLERGVSFGEWFWLLVYPRQITSLRHVWEHPAFAAEAEEVRPNVKRPRSREVSPQREESHAWIAKYAAEIGVDASELVRHARGWLDFGVYWSEGSRFIGTQLPREFWTHYECVTGQLVPEEQRDDFFSCSC